MIEHFHDVQFPVRLALGSSAGPMRSTEIVTLGSGAEQRNARWAHSKRRYEIGQAVRTLSDLHDVLAFFEQRMGRLFAFRFRDPLDHNSSRPGAPVSALDQVIGTGDGVTAAIQLVRTAGPFSLAPRPIRKPVAGTVRVAVNNVEMTEESDFTVDHATGLVTFQTGAIPITGSTITAGFVFDTPVRFDIDELTVNLVAFEAGDIPTIRLIEVLA